MLFSNLGNGHLLFPIQEEYMSQRTGSCPTFGGDTLPETNNSHPKMDGWNAIVSFWHGIFEGATLVSGNAS